VRRGRGEEGVGSSDVFTSGKREEKKMDLEAVHAEIEKRLKLAYVPLASLWVGKVDDGESRLPEVPVDHRIKVEVSFLSGFPTDLCLSH
jgi:hypothetical protein